MYCKKFVNFKENRAVWMTNRDQIVAYHVHLFAQWSGSPHLKQPRALLFVEGPLPVLKFGSAEIFVMPTSWASLAGEMGKTI
uniref:Uncharacterized protein n=1 Tax=Romanomermis culicivorax TaxID=13658 RepID=A0A915IXS1_ROMCU